VFWSIGSHVDDAKYRCKRVQKCFELLHFQPHPLLTTFDRIAFVVETLMWSNMFEQPQETPTDLMRKHYGKCASQTGFKLWRTKFGLKYQAQCSRHSWFLTHIHSVFSLNQKQKQKLMLSSCFSVVSGRVHM